MTREPMDVTRYPLDWPAGKPRTKSPKHSPFGRVGKSLTVAVGTKEVLHELSLMGVGDWNVVISTNIQLRRDGLPYSRQEGLDDAGVAVYFRIGDEPHVLACDAWFSVAENLRAIARHINALRGMERWGVGSLKQAFTGYRALPEAASGASWRRVLELGDGEVSEGDVRTAYRRLALTRHPDRPSGSQEAFVELQGALGDALREIGS